MKKSEHHHPSSSPQNQIKEKHLSYFVLVDACAEKECPVCFLVEKWINNYFDGLLYERVNDGGFRKKFREDKGFCNYHSYVFLNYHDGLAFALTYKDILADQIKVVGKKRHHLQKKESDRECIVCEESQEAEQRYIATLFEYLTDPEFKSRFLASQGLCVPHYKQLLRLKRELPDWLINFQSANYEKILSQMQKYIDNSNYSLGAQRPVLNHDEQLIFKKAAHMISGYQGRIRC